MSIKLEPNRFYHGVFPGGPTTGGTEDEITPELVDRYEQAAGRKVAWVYFSHNWYRNRTFPLPKVQWIGERGAIPFIRLMLRSNGSNPRPEPEYTLKNINSGKYDDDFRAWGRAAKTYGAPLIVEWGTEMNGHWFAWNAKWNGEEKGAKRFRDAFQRIVRLIRDDENADNVTWVFHANDGDDPVERWNKIESYYPGGDYVDWLGMSVYGAQVPTVNSGCDPFSQRAIALHDRLHAMDSSKPIFLLEFGATLNHPNAGSAAQCDASKWADAALTEILERNNMPMLRGFSWWNETWENDDDPQHNTDMRVQSDQKLQEVFRRHLVENEKIIDRPLISD
jgi:hypothetical protein